jgi:hypothetical protein
LFNDPKDITFKSGPIPPPRFGEWILWFILSENDRDIQIGDLAEDYYKLQMELGPRGACLWYYKEVVILIWRRVPGAAKWLILAWFEELLRRLV